MISYIDNTDTVVVQKGQSLDNNGQVYYFIDTTIHIVCFTVLVGDQPKHVFFSVSNLVIFRDI